MRQFVVDSIYNYSNVILIGLILGFVWYAADLIIRQKEFALQTLWGQLGQQRWLFGQWQTALRQKAATVLFCVAAAIYQFEVFFINSLYRERLPWMHEVGTILLDHMFELCLLIKILFCSRYSGRHLTVASGVFFIMRWVFFNNHNSWMIVSVLFVFAAKDVPLRKALKTCFAVGGASVAVVMASSCTGIIRTVFDTETDRYRNSFGYGWYNYFGACLLGLAIMYICLRRVHRMQWYDFALLAALAVFSDRGPDSRSATICFILLFVGLLILRIFPQVLEWLPIRILATASPVLAFALSLLAASSWNPDSKVITTLNGLLSGRVELSWIWLNQMPFRIAGQIPHPDMLVDNAYIQYWIIAGPVASLLVWGAFSLLIWRLLRQQCITEAACALIMLCHGLMEIHVTWSCINVTIWLLAGVLYWTKQQPSFAPQQDMPIKQKRRT